MFLWLFPIRASHLPPSSASQRRSSPSPGHKWLCQISPRCRGAAGCDLRTSPAQTLMARIELRFLASIHAQHVKTMNIFDVSLKLVESLKKPKFWISEWLYNRILHSARVRSQFILSQSFFFLKHGSYTLHVIWQNKPGMGSVGVQSHIHYVKVKQMSGTFTLLYIYLHLQADF